eukprot:7345310-Lingulodinium_polyedra.AAC.1
MPLRASSGRGRVSTPWSEVAAVAFRSPLPKEEKTAQLQAVARQTFGGFGQSKIIEDGLNRLR